MTATSRLLAIAETIDLAHHELCDVAEGLIQATAPTEPAPGLEVPADAPSLVTLPTVDEIARQLLDAEVAQGRVAAGGLDQARAGAGIDAVGDVVNP